MVVEVILLSSREVISLRYEKLEGNGPIAVEMHRADTYLCLGIGTACRRFRGGADGKYWMTGFVD